MNAKKVKDVIRKGLKVELVFALVPSVVSCVVGYLSAGSIGIAWGLLLWLCITVAYVPFCGAVIFQFVLLPWVNSLVHVTKAMMLVEIFWIVYAWIITVTISIAVVLMLIMYILARD